MDPKNLREKVNVAVRAVDDFIAFLKKNDTLKPFICDIEPKNSERCYNYFKCLGKSYFKIQEPQRTSDIEWLLKLMRDMVPELLEEIKPSPLTDRGIPICDQVFYTTDRPLTVDWEYSGTPEPGGTLRYGEMVVSIPRDHRRGGKLKEPHRTHPQNYLAPFVHICDDKRFLGDSEAFFRELNVYINGKARCPDVLIVIHGFNSDLKKNVRRLAKLKKDLEFEGAVILYSWTSAGKKWAYQSDEKTVCATIPLLSKFIWNIQHKVLDEYKSVSGCELNSSFQ